MPDPLSSPPPYAPVPPYSTLPPPPPMPMPPPPGTPRPRRWWPVAGVIGMALGAAIASVISAGTMGGNTSTAPVTITAQPAPPPTPVPLPTADADRATCNTWVTVAKLTREASEAQGVIPEGLSVLDAQKQNNADWKAGVMKAAAAYAKAADVLTVAPGTTPILADAAEGARATLRTLSNAYRTFADTSGNAYAAAKESGVMVNVLCNELAPR